jgi:hypothetical protein
MHHLSPYRSDAEIAAVGRGLCDCSLPKSAWTHAGHFAAALWLLSQHPYAEVVKRLPGLIRTYNESTGGVNSSSAGYHETITLASLRAARHVLLTRPRSGLSDVCAALLSDRFGDPEWLLAHWSRATLLSPTARRIWIQPDLTPLPF